MRNGERGRASGMRSVAWAVLSLAAAPVALTAQTDYYNLDAGRPVVTEDAYATERHAFELQLAPVRVERTLNGVYEWEIGPEVAYGILPATQVEVGAPLVYRDETHEGGTWGLAGIEASVLHNLNVETRTLPALAVAAGAHFPVGGMAPERTYASLRGIATRTFPALRVHLNGEYTFGAEPAAAEHVEGGRWLAGLAVDRAFPLDAALVVGEVYARQPLVAAEAVEWNVGVGMRYQRSPRLALDFGVARRLTGDEQAWSVTFGSAYVFALGSLIPSAR